MACRRRRCREKREGQPSSADQAALKTIQSQPDPVLLTMPGESARLWKHVIFGTGTCVGMIEGYAALQMPGDPLPDVVALRDRLNKVIATLEVTNEDSSPGLQ